MAWFVKSLSYWLIFGSNEEGSGEIAVFEIFAFEMSFNIIQIRF